MSKIVSMSSGAIDPINVTKRVFWTPVTTTTVLKVGQPVCYSSDSVLDHKGRSADPTHLGLTKDTYAQGEQEFIGRLFVVEEPLTANLHAFAGIVKSLGPEDGAIGDMIEIFTPVEGAIVPVWTDDDCTEERTVLGIRDGEADVSYPGVQIGIAQETIDRGAGADDGMCWMRFQKPLFRNANADWQVSDEASATNVIANYIRYETEQTSGSFSALWVRAKSTAGAYANSAAGGGLAAYFRAEVAATIAASCNAVHVMLSITDGTPTEYLSALHVKFHEDGATMTSANKCTALTLELQVTEDVSANNLAYIYFEDNSTQHPDNLFLSSDMTAIAATAVTGSLTLNTDSYLIKVYLSSQPGNQQWYIPLVMKTAD